MQGDGSQTQKPGQTGLKNLLDLWMANDGDADPDIEQQKRELEQGRDGWLLTAPSEDVGFARRVRDAMCDVAQLLDAAKQEWELLGDWSKWDADTRQKVTAVLVECEKEIGRKPAPVEQIARVIYAALPRYDSFTRPAVTWENTTEEDRADARKGARAVLASTPIRQYFRDLDHVNEGKPASVGESHPTVESGSLLEQLMAANLERATRITVKGNVWVRHDVGSCEHLLSLARDSIADLQTEIDMQACEIDRLNELLQSGDRTNASASSANE